MKLKKMILLGLCLTGLLEARTWTSADGSKTFEGDLKAYDASTGQITVLSKGKKMTFKTEKLSESDREFLKTWKPPVTEDSIQESLQSQKVGKNLDDQILSRLDRKKFKKASMKKAPEYYLLYFSASW